MYDVCVYIVVCVHMRVCVVKVCTCTYATMHLCVFACVCPSMLECMCVFDASMCVYVGCTRRWYHRKQNIKPLMSGLCSNAYDMKKALCKVRDVLLIRVV